jgi:hypothetical protein
MQPSFMMTLVRRLYTPAVEQSRDDVIHPSIQAEVYGLGFRV